MYRSRKRTQIGSNFFALPQLDSREVIDKLDRFELLFYSLEEQLKRAKKLYVVGDYTEEQYEQEKETIEKLIADQRRKIAAPAYDANELIEKIRRAGAIISETPDPARFKSAVSMLFTRLEIERQEDGSWKLSKVTPKEEFKEFF